MNKNAIKKFAIDARNKLIASVTDKAGMLGITPDGCSTAITKGADFEVYKTVAGTEVTLNRKQCEQRRKLVDQINSRGFEAVIEEVAYTWFNRICAIRFMEVNDYMYPVRVRILSSEKEGKNEPDILTMAPDVDWNLTDKEREYIIEAKMNNKLDDLFKMLFIKQCNLLHEVLPGLFEETEDYTEMLLNISFTNEDDVVRMLVDGIDEKDFNVNTLDENGEPTGQVEIIGWLYQYYNTELNDEVYDGSMVKSRVPKELLPAATTIYTPDWAIRYMVHNSIGKLWTRSHTNDDLANQWEFYINDNDLESHDLELENIKIIDPCMGSGHILVYCFDVLIQMYERSGYSIRDAAQKIVENNLYGIDISDRAYQLSYFAVMMKARQYDRRALNKNMKINLYPISESNEINVNHLKYFGVKLDELNRKKAYQMCLRLVNDMKDAKEYGSILLIDEFDWDLLFEFVEEYDNFSQLSFDMIGIDETKEQLIAIMEVAKVLDSKFDVVITNPPYLGSSRFSAKLDKYIKKNYLDEKSDLSMVVYKKALVDLVKRDGYVAFITTNSWLVLSRFEKMREFVLSNYSFDSLVDFGTELFEGKVGHNAITAWVNNGKKCKEKFTAIRLVDYCYAKRDLKKSGFFVQSNYYYPNQNDFKEIPGSPIVYSFSKAIFDAFNMYPYLSEVGTTRLGMTTADNNRFTRLWFETDYDNCCFDAKSEDEFLRSGKKWVPYNKGGKYRKWFGNQDCVVNWENSGYEIKNFADDKGKIRSTVPNTEYYFLPCATWSKISSGSIAFRWRDYGSIFDVAGACLYAPKGIYQIMGFLNSCVAEKILSVLSPTLNYEGSHIASLPINPVMLENEEIERLVKENIELAKQDWDDFEFSWNFKRHPLVNGEKTVKSAYEKWVKKSQDRFNKIKDNEIMLNRIFISMYGLEEELVSDILDKDISVRTANLERDIKSLLTYAVGCMFGRYSLDYEGIQYAGGVWDDGKYICFKPDDDNIIPITDEEYFEDDIISKLCDWLKVTFGPEYLDENLEFIASVLNKKGVSAKESIRLYFINDFFKEHSSLCANATSGKRPYYWLFDSGKENGFKALVYYHRIDDDLIGRLRTDYLHKTQGFIESALERAEYLSSSGGGTSKAKVVKEITKYTKQLAELQTYDEAVSHLAAQRIHIDLEDGFKINYGKFQGVEISKEGRKSKKIDLIASN